MTSMIRKPIISSASLLLLAALLLGLSGTTNALAPSDSTNNKLGSRRAALSFLGKSAAAMAVLVPTSSARADDSFDIDSYLKSGGVSMPMGVSGQGGKMRPETGVVLRDGSEVFRDPRNGDVLAELLLKAKDPSGMVAVVASFSSPWPLATGSTYDVECRDANTGDGAYLAVSSDVKGKTIGELSNQFFQDQLFSSTGRFSFYGQPTDVKITKSQVNGNYKTMDVNFSILSQSTGAEVPRKARVIATIPEGASQAVLLIGSASALRWKKGADQKIASTIESFQAIPAPQTSLRLKARPSQSS